MARAYPTREQYTGTSERENGNRDDAEQEEACNETPDAPQRLPTRTTPYPRQLNTDSEKDPTGEESRDASLEVKAQSQAKWQHYVEKNLYPVFRSHVHVRRSNVKQCIRRARLARRLTVEARWRAWRIDCG